MTLSDAERAALSAQLVQLSAPAVPAALLGRTVCQDLFDVLPHLPPAFVDLLIVDPPYNRAKSFNGRTFRQLATEEYESWIDSWMRPVRRVLKPTASVYICCDWRCSASIQRVGARYFRVQNRITWEREKGRGANHNWKNCSEDIWFFTVSRDFTFNVDAVKLKRRVVAPYVTASGQPKGWERTVAGNFRLTHPSNFWTDISVPFWSMPENTNHPAQKPEKLIAKLVLASSHPDDIILDPFLGVGTTSVVAKKLGRNYVGIEIDEAYCCLAEKRLALADTDRAIQGYRDGVFWERNSFGDQKRTSASNVTEASKRPPLFDAERLS